MLTTKISAKWPHASGFTLEKLEVDSKGGVTTETSLVGVAPGLKLEFKGDNTSKGDISATYKHALVTVTGEIDALSLASASASVCGGNGPFTAGLGAKFDIKKSALSPINFAVGYTQPGVFRGVLKSSSTFTEHSVLASYIANKNCTVAAKATHSDKGLLAHLATIYKCERCDLTVKVKAASTGELHASVKKTHHNLAVVAAATVPSTFDGLKFGVNATLG